MLSEKTVRFEKASQDAMGHGALEGQLAISSQGILIVFKLKDRTFRKHDAQQIELPFSEISEVELKKGWFRPIQVRIVVREVDRLSAFPGAETGELLVQIPKEQADAAAAFVSSVEFERAQAELQAVESRTWGEGNADS